MVDVGAWVCVQYLPTRRACLTAYVQSSVSSTAIVVLPAPPEGSKYLPKIPQHLLIEVPESGRFLSL